VHWAEEKDMSHRLRWPTTCAALVNAWNAYCCKPGVKAQHLCAEEGQCRCFMLGKAFVELVDWLLPGCTPCPPSLPLKVCPHGACFLRAYWLGSPWFPVCMLAAGRLHCTCTLQLMLPHFLGSLSDPFSYSFRCSAWPDTLNSSMAVSCPRSAGWPPEGCPDGAGHSTDLCGDRVASCS